ncbi:MAG: hypothetical protein H8E34_10085 [Bacteroidetes bacterium]|nr:hypothetical protein [Bacteroidota bacterium]MBL6944517.1 hypothetical protein [Bacteroidales bacterium]
MKKLTKILFVSLTTCVLITSCQEAKEILYVKFNADYQTEFEVVVPPISSVKTDIYGEFAVSETIDPNSSSEYQQYIDNIIGIEINEVTGEVLSISKNVMLESAVISVMNESYNATWEFTNEPITVGTSLTLDNSSGQWDAIENILMDKKVFTVSIAGQADADDVEFVVLFTLKSEVTANPLD